MIEVVNDTGKWYPQERVTAFDSGQALVRSLRQPKDYSSWIISPNTIILKMPYYSREMLEFFLVLDKNVSFQEWIVECYV